MKKLRHRKRSPAEVVCQGEVSQLLRLHGGGGGGGASPLTWFSNAASEVVLVPGWYKFTFGLMVNP